MTEEGEMMTFLYVLQCKVGFHSWGSGYVLYSNSILMGITFARHLAKKLRKWMRWSLCNLKMLHWHEVYRCEKKKIYTDHTSLQRPLPILEKEDSCSFSLMRGINKVWEKDHTINHFKMNEWSSDSSCLRSIVTPCYTSQFTSSKPFPHHCNLNRCLYHTSACPAPSWILEKSFMGFVIQTLSFFYLDGDQATKHIERYHFHR